jgi:hypothetical protein
MAASRSQTNTNPPLLTKGGRTVLSTTALIKQRQGGRTALTIEQRRERNRKATAHIQALAALRGILFPPKEEEGGSKVKEEKEKSAVVGADTITSSKAKTQDQSQTLLQDEDKTSPACPGIEGNGNLNLHSPTPKRYSEKDTKVCLHIISISLSETIF